MNLIGKANDPKFWAEIKNKPEFKRMLDLLVKEYQKDGMGEIPCTKFSEFRLFNDIGDRTIYQVNFFFLLFEKVCLFVYQFFEVSSCE